MRIRELTDFAKKAWGYTTESFKEKFTTTTKTPPWMTTATNLMNTDEVKGRGSNPVIIGWAKRLGGWVANYYKSDDIPWCGLFMAHCLSVNKVDISNIKNPLSARAWLKLGYSVEPCFGSIIVFWRVSKNGALGHVGFYVSEDKDFYHILGGNQSDSVNIQKVSKSRFLGARWPTNFKTLHKENEGRVIKKFDGKISINED
jgi:uncharacterized protein (TIGR02594 family)